MKTLDEKLNILGLKHKKLFVIDTGFPHVLLPKFKQTYPNRIIQMPNRPDAIYGYAAGLASTGILVLVVGAHYKAKSILDPTLNVKFIKMDSSAEWKNFEKDLFEFGPAELLIPEND